MMSEEVIKEKKWYQKVWGIILLLMFFFPAGLYFLWKSDYSKSVKLIGTFIIAALVVYSVATQDQRQLVPQVQSSRPLQQQSEQVELPKAEESKVKTYGGGQLKVGKDIPAGEYVAIGSGYLEVTPDSSGNIMNIIMNENVTNRYYVTIYDGEYIKVTGNLRLYTISEAPKVDLSKGILKDGQFELPTA